MMAQGHRAAAPSFVIGVGIAINHFGSVNVIQVLAAAVISVPFAAGRLSPDADQTWLKTLGHRRIVHWWGWPAAVIGVLLYLGAPFVAFGPALGWLSHLVPCDLVFGKGGPDIPKGIPIFPWRRSRRLGLGLRVTGRGGRQHSVLEGSATLLLIPLIPLLAVALVQGAWLQGEIGGLLSRLRA